MFCESRYRYLMISSAFLSLLTAIVGEPAFYFEFCTVHFDDVTRRLFVVLGQHRLHFVRRDGLNVIEGSGLPYACISKVSSFFASRNVIVLELDESRPYVKGTTVDLRCLRGPEFLRQLHVAYCSDSLVRLGVLRLPTEQIMRYGKPTVPRECRVEPTQPRWTLRIG